MANDCTCSALRMAARRLTQAYDVALAGEGLTTPQFSLLAGLVRQDGAAPTVNDLAERLALDRTTLAHNLQPLVRDGLVQVLTDVEDRRVKRIRLTDLGRSRHHRAYPRWRAVQERFDAAFGAERSAELRRTLIDIAHLPSLPDRPVDGANPTGQAPNPSEHSHAG